MEKSPDAFRTISEVADWLDVPTHVLRFWESRFSQVRPVKRAGGRRYYRPADMRLIGGIKRLLHDDGMTIRGVQKLLREEGVKHVSGFSQPLDHEAQGAMELPSSRRALEDHEGELIEGETGSVVEFGSAGREAEAPDAAQDAPPVEEAAILAPVPDDHAPADPEDDMIDAVAHAAEAPEPELPLNGDANTLPGPFLSDAPLTDPEDVAAEHASAPGLVARLMVQDRNALAANRLKLEQVVAALHTIRERQ
jgi:DNA-binding transcriptional MerR regulator